MLIESPVTPVYNEDMFSVLEIPVTSATPTPKVEITLEKLNQVCWCFLVRSIKALQQHF